MIKKIKFVFSFISKDPYLFIAFFTALILRLMNLGYSDYQGDEIKALFLPEENQSIASFLLDQRKGPLQFLITFLLKIIDPTYSNEFLNRLPFAIAGILAVFFFYKFVKIVFDEKIAFFSAMLMATNGFFIAFSRIVQYQSFVILFMVLTLYLLALAVTNKKYRLKGIYLGFIAWSLSLLSHYDGIFIAPFVIYFLYVWFKLADLTNKSKLKHILLSIIVPGILLASFYIPFALNITADTQQYWQGRLTGDVSAKISSSKYLFSVYHPIYVVHFYTLLTIFGFLLFVSSFIRNKFKNYIDKKNLSKIFSPYISGLFLHTDNKKRLLALTAWFLFPFVFWEYFVYISGTHIYTYLIPVFIVAAFGMYFGEKLINLIVRIEYRRVLNFSWVLIFFVFTFLQSYFVYVDNTYEYPWEEEKFLLWTFPKPIPIFHLSMFGFPYNRNWEGIAEFVKQYPDVKGYSTNERQTISRHYIPYHKGSDQAGFYVLITDPQSFENNILSEKAFYWASKNEPVYTFSRRGKTLVSVFLMPVGTLQELIDKGY